MEHTWKSAFYDGRTISVTNPDFYKDRFVGAISSNIFPPFPRGTSLYRKKKPSSASQPTSKMASTNSLAPPPSTLLQPQSLDASTTSLASASAGSMTTSLGIERRNSSRRSSSSRRKTSRDYLHGNLSSSAQGNLLSAQGTPPTRRSFSSTQGTAQKQSSSAIKRPSLSQAVALTADMPIGRDDKDALTSHDKEQSAADVSAIASTESSASTQSNPNPNPTIQSILRVSPTHGTSSSHPTNQGQSTETTRVKGASSNSSEHSSQICESSSSTLIEVKQGQTASAVETHQSTMVYDSTTKNSHVRPLSLD